MGAHASEARPGRLGGASSNQASSRYTGRCAGSRSPLLLVCLAAFAAVSEAANPLARLVGNPADRLVSVALEDYSYDHASGCKPGPSRGAVAMQAWLERYVRGTPLGIVRCEKLSGDDFSLHAAGRAIDWHLNARDRRGRRAADRPVALLLLRRRR